MLTSFKPLLVVQGCPELQVPAGRPAPSAGLLEAQHVGFGVWDVREELAESGEYEQGRFRSWPTYQITSPPHPLTRSLSDLQAKLALLPPRFCYGSGRTECRHCLF